jgi:hypothetical protein
MGETGRFKALTTAYLALIACASSACGSHAVTSGPSGSDSGGASSGGVRETGGSQSGGGAAGINLGGGGTAGSLGGTAGAVTAGAGGPSDEGVPLVPMNGVIADNPTMIQGAVFAVADTTSNESLTSDVNGPKICMQGIAARINLDCDPAPTQCSSRYFGAMLGMNLNQQINPMSTDNQFGDPLSFDASALRGFSFDLDGQDIPSNALFFAAEDGNNQYPTPSSQKLLAGRNVVLFSELLTSDVTLAQGTMRMPESAKAGLVKILWRVRGTASAAVPFDFCVSNIRALGN